MRCEYCCVEVTDYPASGLCNCCGGKLPPKPAPRQTEPQPVHVQPVYVPVSTPPMGCPKCSSTQIISIRRGFSWGWGIFGFFMIPGFGLLFGFCGSKKPRLKCTHCSHKWKPY